MGQGHQGGPLHGEDAAGPSRQVQARLPLTGDPRAHLAGGPRAHLAGDPRAHLAGGPRAHLAGGPRAHQAGDPRAHLAGGLLTCWFVNSEQAVKYLKLKNQKNSEKFPATVHSFQV